MATEYPQTQLAVENFPISQLRFPRSFMRALGLIKAAAAKVNGELATATALAPIIGYDNARSHRERGV